MVAREGRFTLPSRLPAATRPATRNRQAVALEDADVREVAVLLGEVEAVADDELRAGSGSRRSEVVVGLLEALADQQGAHLEAGGAAGRERLAQVGRA